jgi:hypothetical protein
MTSEILNSLARRLLQTKTSKFTWKKVVGREFDSSMDALGEVQNRLPASQPHQVKGVTCSRCPDGAKPGLL